MIRFFRDPHLSDEEILRAIDGELSERPARAAWAHLVACPECRSRQRRMEETSAQLTRLMGEAPSLPDAQRRLLEAIRREPEPAVLRPGGRRRWVRAAASAAAAIGLLWMFTGRVPAGSLPDSRLTPGATRSVSKDQICVAAPGDDEPAVAAEVAMQVFRQYGIAEPQPRAYEVDYLITPALGGAGDIRNLWPQPYETGPWSAKVKDALEDHLRMLVCQGKLDLGTAQRELATDWIAAYRRYFHSVRPLPGHTEFIKDRPWE